MDDVTEKITALARGMAESHGLELVDVELQRGGRRRLLRVYVGKAEGVSMEDCARMSHGLSAVLDAEDWMGDSPYLLEVSSPGVDRPFKALADWRRNLGRDVRVFCRERVAGKLEWEGRLTSVDEHEAVLENRGQALRVPLRQVAQAKLEIKIP